MQVNGTVVEQYDESETLIRMADEDMFVAKKNKLKVTNIKSLGKKTK